MAGRDLPLLLALLAVACCGAMASDPGLLQDFCVADKTSKGYDLIYIEGNTTNKQGSAATAANVAQIPGLNTMGISMARIDFAPSGLNAPHIHPRATEVLTVLEGSLYVVFVTSIPGSRLISKVLRKGDVFVFPQALVHLQFNYGTENAVAIAALSSQNPGVVTVANAVFASNPSVSDDILSKAFQVDKKDGELD